MTDHSLAHDHDTHDHDTQDGRPRGSRRTALWSGALLIALGTAMVVVAASGDSVFYVRDAMTVPLIAAGVVVVILGFAAATGVVAPAHAPRSMLLVAVAAIFVLIDRPGPLSVEAGLTYDAQAGGTVQNRFEIPRDAIVGAGADVEAIDDRAVELHAGQVYFAATQFPEVFDEVALRMIGQLDRRDDGSFQLVRFRITCCAADALRLSVGLDLDRATAPTGSTDSTDGDASGVDTIEQAAWVEITGQWDGDVDEPGIDVASIRVIDQPDRPYLTLRDD